MTSMRHMWITNAFKSAHPDLLSASSVYSALQKAGIETYALDPPSLDLVN